MDRRLEFPDQGVAVIDLQAVCDLQDLDPFPGQSTTDALLGIRDVQLALTVDFKHPGSFRILPTRRI